MPTKPLTSTEKLRNRLNQTEHRMLTQLAKLTDNLLTAIDAERTSRGRGHKSRKAEKSLADAYTEAECFLDDHGLT